MNAPTLTRRGFLAAGAAAVAGCAKPPRQTGEFAGRTLRMFVYAGGHEETVRTVFAPHFEALTGATVVLDPGWWDGTAKLKAAPDGKPPFDLMITDATQGYPAAREGLFAKLDLAQLPNASKLAPAALDHWVVREGHGVTYPDAVMTLGYRRDKLGAPPASWADLLRPELDGKLGLYNHFYMSLYTFAAMLAESGGGERRAGVMIRAQLDEVFRFARQERRRVKLWWPTTSDQILSLVGGSVLAGNMQSPEYVAALREKPELGAFVSPTNRSMVQVFWAVPAGTPNRDMAVRALDELFGYDVQLGFARRGMATARPDAAAAMALESPEWARLYPHTAEGFAALEYYPYDVYAAHWDELAARWERTVLRDG